MRKPARETALADARVLLEHLQSGDISHSDLAVLLRRHRGVKRVRVARVRNLVEVLNGIPLGRSRTPVYALDLSDIDLDLEAPNPEPPAEPSADVLAAAPSVGTLRDRIASWMSSEKKRRTRLRAKGKAWLGPITFGEVFEAFADDFDSVDQVITHLHGGLR